MAQKNQDSHAKVSVNCQCAQLVRLPAWEGDNCMCVQVFVNGVCMYGLAVVKAL